MFHYGEKTKELLQTRHHVSYNSGRQQEKNWGYRLLDLTGDTVSTEYIRV